MNKFNHNGLLTKGGDIENFFVSVKVNVENSNEQAIYESSCTQKEIDSKKAEQAIKNYHKALMQFVKLMNDVFVSKVRINRIN
jgi:hypothetical protein